MEFLIKYAETLGIFLFIAVISLMLWITPPKPWRYYWWFLGFISPFLLSLAFHFYFHNPGNYPVGLCLKSEITRPSLEEITSNINKVTMQITFLEVKKDKSDEELKHLDQLHEEYETLDSDQQALTKNPQDKIKFKELMIVRRKQKSNQYIEWDRQVKKVKLKENFVYQKTKNLKFHPFNCPKDLKNAAKPYVKKKEPLFQWLYSNF